MNGKRARQEILLVSIPIVSIIFTAIIYAFLPDKVPASYHLSGQVASFSDKSPMIFLLPGLAVAMYLYFYIVPFIDPSRKSYEKFRDSYVKMRFYLEASLLIINLVYILSAYYPYSLELVIAVKVGVAVGLMLFGDRLPKIKPNYFIGVVDPWTLASPEVWGKTQRFTGKLMFIISFMLLVLSFISRDWSNAAYMALILVLLLAPHIYAGNAFYVRTKTIDKKDNLTGGN